MGRTILSARQPDNLNISKQGGFVNAWLQLFPELLQQFLSADAAGAADADAGHAAACSAAGPAAVGGVAPEILVQNANLTVARIA